jgi:D-cysteine desulfhydrase
LILGLKLLDIQTRIIGISDGEPCDELMRLVLNVAREGAALLGTRIELSEEDVTVYDEYFGEGYGLPTPEMVAAVRMVARSEGILLDPVYSGKAMAGLIDLIRKGVFEEDQKVLFIHAE